MKCALSRTVRTSAIGLPFVLLMATLPQAQITFMFDPPVNVTNSPSFSHKLQGIDYDPVRDRIYLTGIGSPDMDSRTDVFFSRSTDGGMTFSALQNLSNTIPPVSAFGATSYYDEVSDRRYMMWGETGGASNSVSFVRSTDGGATFSPKQDLATTDLLGTGRPWDLDYDPAGDRLFVALTNGTVATFGPGDAFVRRSTNGGTDFSPPINLSESLPGRADSPQIAVDANGNAYITYGNYPAGSQFPSSGDVYLNLSSDGGGTWSAPFNLSNSPNASVAPVIATGPGGAHVAWRQEGSTSAADEIFYCVSSDGGMTWSVPQNVSNQTGSSNEAQIRVDSNGNAHIVWTELTFSPVAEANIYHNWSSDGGLTWPNGRRVSNTPDFSVLPQIVVDDQGIISVNWLDLFPTSAVRLSRSTDAGVNWSPAVDVSTAQNLGRSALFLDNQNRVHVVWDDSDIFHVGEQGGTGPPGATELFLPIVLSSDGLKNSFFTSELTITNRGPDDADIQFTYTPAFGGGSSGSASIMIPSGEQRILPDAIQDLNALGIPIPPSGNRGGTVGAAVLSSNSNIAAIVRVTTAVPGGRAGLAYFGLTPPSTLAQPSVLAGLRQNTQDRSNVAFQNAGKPADGNITLRVTAFSGDPAVPGSVALPDVPLAPGGFFQYSGVLDSAGFTNGYVMVERLSGTAPYYTYGVINDQANSDGSFVFPVTEASLVGKTGQILPVIVETGLFNSELTVTNFSSTAKTLDFSFVADAVTTADDTARFSMTLPAGEQRIIPNIVDDLRQQGVMGIGPAGPTFAGALFASVLAGT